MSWELKNLEELGFIGRGKSRHRPRNDEKLYNGLYPLIQTSEIQSSNLYINSFSKTYNDFGLSQSKLWKAGTLCLSIVGANTAETAILGFDACFPDSVIGFNAYENISDNLFIKYFFDFIKVELKSISEGTARENLSLEKLLSKKRLVPNYIIQKRIANILSEYDDLIENNLKRIKLLEETAQNIYKEWFVNFRFPNYEHTEFDVESGLPVGWEKKNINEVFNIKYGKNLPTTLIKSSGKYNVYGASGVMGYYEEKNVSERVVLITSRGNGSGEIHRTFQEETFVTNNSFVVFPKENYNQIPFFFITECLKSLNLKSYCSGSAQPQLTNASMNNLEITLPSIDLIIDFKFKVSPIYDLIDKLYFQNQNLKEARDILLPRLMNRTIEV